MRNEKISLRMRECLPADAILESDQLRRLRRTCNIYARVGGCFFMVEEHTLLVCSIVGVGNIVSVKLAGKQPNIIKTTSATVKKRIPSLIFHVSNIKNDVSDSINILWWFYNINKYFKVRYLLLNKLRNCLKVKHGRPYLFTNKLCFQSVQCNCDLGHLNSKISFIEIKNNSSGNLYGKVKTFAILESVYQIFGL